MTDPLSITASVISITVLALHGIRLLIEDLQLLKEAPKTVKRLLEDVKSVETSTKFGADHSRTLTSMNNPSVTYKHQGLWDDAEMLDMQVMETSKAKLGADHPDTLTSMSNLASAYWGQGRWDEAETLFVESGELSIHSFDDGDIPPYAILSHTWGADGDEVTFADLQTGGGKIKLGYEKILFCGKQARRDNLQYFWIDTCCIDKANKAELAFSIRSMFRWYRDAARCYVYLSDVSTQPLLATQDHRDSQWLFWIWILSILYTMSRWYGSTIQRYFYSRYVPCTPVGNDLVRSTQMPKFTLKKSRWFTRGWTLQELLAPSIVEFFSKEGTKLGDKLLLAKEVREVTGIPSSALQGEPLSNFDVYERVTWIEHRTTTIPADRAYSLMGILGVSLSPIDGENLAEAMKRVLDEVDKQNKCLQDLRPSNPRDDKKRIEETKGGLLAGAYRWVLDNDTFQQWQQDPESRLLWVKGDPGKGKTMLLCGIIDELQNLTPKPTLVSYFFCQATDSRINSASAVLRGLLYMLVDQQPSLTVHIRKKHDRVGKSLFEDANAWVALIEIFADVLRDTGLITTYLIIDALDECMTDQVKLLSFIAEQSSACSHVKWIVSSRNWPTIEEQLKRAERKTPLSLELNAESVAAAVRVFIQQKSCQLAQEKRYTPEVHDAVLQHLTSNANDTFLWVALVCQDLKATPKWDVLEKLAQFPPSLDLLYRQMLDQIRKSSSARRCLRVLAVTTVLYRPVAVAELVVLTKQLADLVDDLESVREIIGLCGSFLTLRDDTVYFVHQSAKDFLITQASNEVFPNGAECVHQDIFAKSLTVLQKTLDRDLYNLQAPGYPIEDVRLPLLDPLAVSRYPCIYWIDHFYDSKHMTQAHSAANQEDTRTIETFFRQRYLYWLEALSLCRSIATGVVSITKLWDLVQGLKDTDALTETVYDARRFVMYHKEAIENYPLQAYASALLFSPADSLTRRLFRHEEPAGIGVKPAMSSSWSACLQTLEGHSSPVSLVAFSHDSSQLASASYDCTIKIWDTSSGTCLQTLKGHINNVMSVAFSHDSSRLASASSDKTIKIWDLSSKTCLHTLKGHSSTISSVAFSHDSSQLASASSDKTVKIWDASSGTRLRTFKGHSSTISLVAFSHDSNQLASASYDRTIKIWNTSSSICLQTLKGHSNWVNSLAFSHDSSRLASASSDRTAKIWDTSSGTCLQTLKGHINNIMSVAFSHDSSRLASASSDKTIKIWDLSSKTCLHTLKGHSSTISSVAFSHDSSQLASASSDKTVKIWDASSGTRLNTIDGHSDAVTLLGFSHDSTRLASASYDRTVKIWDTSSGTCLQTLEGHGDDISSVGFSHDSTQLASASYDSLVRIWNASSGICLHTLKGHKDYVSSVAFSHNSSQLASASSDKTVKIWDVSSGICLHTLDGHSDAIRLVVFSHDSIWLASASSDKTVKIWDTSSGTCLHTLDGHSDAIRSVAFSHDSIRLASASSDRTIKIWDVSSGIYLYTLKGHKSYISSVAFSRNSSRLASASKDETVKIWGVSSGTCLHTLNISMSLSRLSFGSTDTVLHTEIGTVIIPSSQVSSSADVAVSKPQYQNVSLSPDGVWVMRAGVKRLRIPSEYRPSCSAVSGALVGMGVGSGKVWLCQAI
ncbi:uncharacterized protein yc1106_06635 [Curvularia clavata]|uniref:NACHT domain-containing protein n=1 Tax=Curvularia clavata TaxID=95742 RepID=A0A9Q8ZA63_CURCL|nr:uncharacterized protein yc1106_06635 [Curvularia clavata]